MDATDEISTSTAGASPEAARASKTSSDPNELTDDALAGPVRLLQRRRGHRYSLDDVATAWTAARAAPNARRALDLGCGIGSVLLMVGYKLWARQRAEDAGGAPKVEMIGVEAQEVSHGLAVQNVERARAALPGLEARVVRGDLRDPGVLDPSTARFELISGTPPYMPVGTGSPSTDSQRTYARIEMRGGIEAYLEAAARWLSPGGVFIACCDARTPERALDGAAAAGLVAARRMDVVPRLGKRGALFTVWTFRRGDATLVVDPPLVARDEAGARTDQAHELRRFFDLPVNRDEPASAPTRERGQTASGA